MLFKFFYYTSSNELFHRENFEVGIVKAKNSDVARVAVKKSICKYFDHILEHGYKGFEEEYNEKYNREVNYSIETMKIEELDLQEGQAYVICGGC